MSRDAASSDRRVRLARALRENLKRRKAQGRGRAAGSVVSTPAPAGTKGDEADAGAPASIGKTKDD